MKIVSSAWVCFEATTIKILTNSKRFVVKRFLFAFWGINNKLKDHLLNFFPQILVAIEKRKILHSLTWFFLVTNIKVNHFISVCFHVKLVLSVLIAVAAAAPSGIHGYGAYPLAYDLAPEYHVSNVITGHVPTAVSHQSRVDYHSKPVITPIIQNQVHAIPQPAYAVHSAPLIHAASPYYASHGYGAGLYDAHAW